MAPGESLSGLRSMSEPRRFLSILRRILLLGAGVILLLAAIAAAYVKFGIIDRYAKKADEYDLSKIDVVEAASIVYDRYGQVYGKIFVQNREPVTFDQLSPNLVNAVISAEDNRFYEHTGIDFWGIVRAFFKNTEAGRIRQGASTVTQQLARNAFDLKDRTYDRKILEVFLAMRIDKALPKNKIMELYLNRVYFGGGLYGAEAAARGYFGKSAKELSPGEAAMLAALLKSPNSLSPWHNLQTAQAERDFVLGRMVENKKISEAVAKDEESKPLVVRPKGSSFVSESYVIDEIRSQLQGDLDLESFASEGYRIYTTIDPALQKVAQDSVKARLNEVEQYPGYNHQTYADYSEIYKNWRTTHTSGNPPDAEYLQGAVVVVDNRTGGILALVGGRDYAQSQYNRIFQSPRPCGGAFTPFVFAAAFQKGIFPGSLVDDLPLDNRQVMIGGTSGILGEWEVEQVDNRYEGAIPLRQVLTEGKNAATVRLGNQIGVETVRKLAKAAGFENDLRPYPATYLGSSEVTLEDLAKAYTIFPRGGTRPDELNLITKIETSDGHEVYHAENKSDNVVDPGIAYEVHSFLIDALANGTGAKAASEFGLSKLPVAGKTGTAYNFTDVCFAGYDSEITCAVWAGYDKPQSIFRGAFANDIALPIWVDVMNTSAQKYPPHELGRPLDLKRVEVCLSTGVLATPQCSLLTPVSNDSNQAPRKGTIFEFTTAAQQPKEHCWLHGNDQRSFIKAIRNQEDIPRAVSVADNAKFPIVIPRASTVVGDDPWGAEKPKPEASPTPNNTTTLAQQTQASVPRAELVATPTPEPVVRRAEIVGPLDRVENKPKVDLPTPEPVDLGHDPTNL
jgi:penicillin-binding protein 1A